MTTNSCEESRQANACNHLLCVLVVQFEGAPRNYSETAPCIPTAKQQPEHHEKASKDMLYKVLRSFHGGTMKKKKN